MLTLAEILSDFAATLGSGGSSEVTVKTRGQHGDTALHWMATIGDAKAIRLLVQEGADISATDKKGNTPLHEAVTYRQTVAAKTLMELGANTNVRNSVGLTPQDMAQNDNFIPTLELFANT